MPDMKLFSVAALKEKHFSKNLEIENTFFLYSFLFHKFRLSGGTYLLQIHAGGENNKQKLFM